MNAENGSLLGGGVDSVLIIKPSSLGDIVHTLPSLHAMRKAWPKAHIAWLVAENNAPLIEGHPHIDELIRFPRSRWRTPLKAALDMPGFLGFLEGLSERKFDLALDYQGLFRSGLFALHSRARVRLGFRKAREGAWAFYSHPVTLPQPKMHAVDRYAHLTRAAGVEVDTSKFLLPRNEQAVAGLATLFAKHHVDKRPLVLFQPFGRWDSKNWLIGHYIELGRLLTKGETVSLCILGGESEREECEYIAAEIGGPAVSLAGETTIQEMVEAVRGADLLVGCDSGPMHLAAAFGVPVVALYGPTNPVLCGPYGQMGNALQASLDCIQCYERTCPRRENAFMKCMKDLTPELVVEHCRRLLSEIRRAPHP